MSLSGYHLRGIEEDYILVFRSDDSEDILRIITRLCASRDKEIRALGKNLELEWNQNQIEQLSQVQGRSGPKDSSKGKDRSRNRNRQAPAGK